MCDPSNKFNDIRPGFDNPVEATAFFDRVLLPVLRRDQQLFDACNAMGHHGYPLIAVRYRALVTPHLMAGIEHEEINAKIRTVGLAAAVYTANLPLSEAQRIADATIFEIRHEYYSSVCRAKRQRMIKHLSSMSGYFEPWDEVVFDDILASAAKQKAGARDWLSPAG